MPDLYILFEKSNSTIGKIGRLVMPYPYTHVTISFDGETYHSFSKRKLHDPFDAGFTDEKLAYFAYEEVEVRIYTLKITDEEKTKIEAFMDQVKDCPFDVMDMVLAEGSSAEYDIVYEATGGNKYGCKGIISSYSENHGADADTEPTGSITIQSSGAFAKITQ